MIFSEVSFDKENEAMSLEELSLQAKREIGETEVDITEKIKELKLFLQESNPGLILPSNFDGFLLRCLRVRKFDVHRAGKMVPQYFRLLGDLASYSDPFGPSSCSYFYNKLSHAVLKGRDFLGRPVILARQELVAPTEFEHAFCSVFFLIDYLNMISVDTQRLGVVVICDWQGYSFQHLRNTKPAHFRISAQMFQDSFPARFKAIHFVRNPYLVSCMYAIAKPLLREKIRNRVHFHGHNLEALHQHVSVDILPEFLGGKLPADGYADIEITSGVVDGDNYYSEILRQQSEPRERKQ